MADKHLTDNLKGNYFSSERKDMKFLKGFTFDCAYFLYWAGYAFAAIHNGDNNKLWYRTNSCIDFGISP